MGALVLASTAGMAAPDAPGAYYARQRIEQVFDVGKNYASLLPLRVHSEKAPRGHLRAHVGRERALSGDRRQVSGGGSVRLW